MPSVFDLLEDIENRPGLFLGWTPADRGEQLRDLEAVLMGYGHAVDRHGVDDPGRNFLQSFGRFLRERYDWTESSGPIASIRAHATSDEEAWQLTWKLIWEFRASLGG